MKSVKPGRGPSALGAWGAVVMVAFGIFWTAAVLNMGAPFIFPAFGVLFIITGVITGLYNWRNATGKNRYSSFDITEEGEEPDPLERRFEQEEDGEEARPGAGFCPYCGAPADADYAFCRQCGKRLP